MPVTILLADDHAIVRQGLRALLEMRKDLQVIGEAGDGIEAIHQVETLHPQVTVLDIMMPGLNGLEVTRQIHSKTKVIILSMYKDEGYVATALQNGAMAFVLKDSTSTDLVDAIQSVLQGRHYLCQPFTEEKIQAYQKKFLSSSHPKIDLLTNRERQVLQLVAEGCTTAEAANKLHISPRTVEIHRAHIYEKLGMHSQADLTRFAIQQGLVKV
jgi:DNA-binding NarL/FixJ family response regulator